MFHRGMAVTIGSLLLCGSSLVLAPAAVAIPTCIDADGDGSCAEVDCDDAQPGCAVDCTDGDADGACDDQDNCPGLANPHQGLRVKLNAPLVPGGNTWSFLVSPDGKRIVYRAEVDSPGTEELFSVATRGGSSTKLNVPIAPAGDLVAYAITADSSTVVYRTPDTGSLYSVPIDGGTSTLLSPTVLNFIPFRLTSDSSTVVYGYASNGTYELYSVPVSGGTPVQLNHHLAAGYELYDFLVSPDGTTVVYRTQAVPSSGTRRIYRVPVGGGPALEIDGSFVAGGEVVAYTVSPDSSRVVYLADQDIDGVDELYSVPLSGGTPTKVNTPLTPGTTDVASNWTFTPNSALVLYRTAINGTLSKLFSAPLSGGAPVQLNVTGSSPLEGGVTPDNAYVVVQAGAAVYQIPLDGGAATGLAGGAGGNKVVLSPDGSTVLFVSAIGPKGNQLRSVPVGGGPVTTLGVSSPGIALIQGFAASPDSSHAVYLMVGQEVTGVWELFTVPIDGGVVRKLNGKLVVGGNVNVDFSVAGYDSRVVYRADQEINESEEIYAVPLGEGMDSDADGAGAACDCDDTREFCATDCTDADGDSACITHDCDDQTVACGVICSDVDGDATCDDLDNCVEASNPSQVKVRLNGTLVTDGDVLQDPTNHPVTTPDGSHVIYRADEDVNGQNELYSVPSVGGAVTRLNATLTLGGDVLSFAVSADSSSVVYLADQDLSGVQELFRVAVGGGAVTKLNPSLGPSGDVLSFALSPDGSRVVYRADQDTDAVNELYSVPIGGGAATKLNSPMATGGNVSTFALSGDGSRVIYRADQAVNDQDELYSVPLGGGSVTQLNPPMATGHDVASFVPSPGGSRVVYLSDQQVAQNWELFSVPTTGGASVQLNPPVTPSNNVWDDYKISPDGAFVVYRLDLTKQEVYDLYSAPIGGGTAVKLNNPSFPTGALVKQFGFTPDSARVVYVADQVTVDVNELYSVPTAGGAAVKLSSALVAGGDVGQFVATNAAVVYMADASTNNLFELYRAPIGGGTVIKLNAPLIGGGSVTSFVVSPNGSLVLYIAGQDTDGMIKDLYAIPGTGGTSQKVSAPSVLNGGVAWHSFSPDAARAVYVGDLATVGTFELYARAVAGAAGDQDGDGHGGACDCAAGNGAVWELPDEARSLQFLADKQTLSWIAPLVPGGTSGSVAFDTVRSTVPANFGGGTCVETDDAADLQAQDLSLPGSGAVFYYLVRPQNACGAGGVGTDSEGNPRPPAVACGS